MFIVGIDPSLSSTGVCVYDTATGQTYAEQIDGHFKDEPHVGERCDRIACHVLSAIVNSGLLDACDNIEVFIEEPSGRLLGEAMDLRTLYWNIIRWLEHDEFLYQTIYPVPNATLKKFLTGKGNGKPEDKALAVLTDYHNLLPEEKVVGPGTSLGLLCYKDLYDAVGLAALGRVVLEPDTAPKWKQEAVKNIGRL